MQAHIFRATVAISGQSLWRAANPNLVLTSKSAWTTLNDTDFT